MAIETTARTPGGLTLDDVFVVDADVHVHQDPAAAVKEIERWAGHPRFVAVFLPTCQAYPLWGHRRYFPIFEAAQAAGLPVALHSVSGSSWGFPFNVEQFTSAPTGHTAS